MVQPIAGERLVGGRFPVERVDVSKNKLMGREINLTIPFSEEVKKEMAFNRGNEDVSNGLEVIYNICQKENSSIDIKWLWLYEHDRHRFIFSKGLDKENLEMTHVALQDLHGTEEIRRRVIQDIKDKFEKLAIKNIESNKQIRVKILRALVQLYDKEPLQSMACPVLCKILELDKNVIIPNAKYLADKGLAELTWLTNIEFRIKITSEGIDYLEDLKTNHKDILVEGEYNIMQEEFITQQKAKNQKLIKCFVIMPIGEKGTIEYKNNLSVYNYIIKPCTENSGYNIECYHADLIKKSGDISKQVIEALRDDDIVIADLRRGNSNVIYELGIRHAFGKRSILVCSSQTEHFFHTTKYRAIPYRIDGKSNQDFHDSLTSYVDDIIKNPKKHDNPVTDTAGVYFNKSDDSVNKKILEETRIQQCVEKYTATSAGESLIKMIETYDDLTNEERAALLDKALIRGRGRKAKDNPFRKKAVADNP